MEQQFLMEHFDSRALRDIWRIIYEKYGIYFGPDKVFSLKHKLARRLRKLAIESPEEYLKYLTNNPAEIPLLLDAVSTNKTYFFRETHHWHFLQEKILSNQQTKTADYRVWSSACSTGEEVYSTAMILDDFARTSRLDFSYRVLGTDLSQRVLSRAIRAVYNKTDLEKVRQFENNYNSRYFEKSPQGIGWLIKDKIQRHVYFRLFNLRESNYPFRKRFDLILCRNVLIYFDKEMIYHTINELTKALKTGGYLFIGHTESLHNIEHSLTKIQPAIYRK